MYDHRSASTQDYGFKSLVDAVFCEESNCDGFAPRELPAHLSFCIFKI